MQKMSPQSNYWKAMGFQISYSTHKHEKLLTNNNNPDKLHTQKCNQSKQDGWMYDGWLYSDTSLKVKCTLYFLGGSEGRRMGGLWISNQLKWIACLWN